MVYDSSNNVFDINSSLYGARSSIELVSVDVGSENDLGLAIGAGDNGEDVEGLINGQDASGNGKILTSSGSFGISVEVVSGITGNRGVISISEGIVTNVDNLLAGFMRFDGIIKVREDGLNERLLNIAQDREELDLRIASVEARFIKQFAALDGLIAQFNSTSSFLESQLNNLVEPNSIGRR